VEKMAANPDQRNRSLDEGSWIYLSLGGSFERDLRRCVEAACEDSGWAVVSWPAERRPLGETTGEGSMPEGASHAIEHADAVVLFADGDSERAGRVFDCALEFQRPLIGLSLRGSGDRKIKARIQSSPSGRLLECADARDCAEALRRALAEDETYVTTTVSRA
jgi:hypothetical protein